MTKASLALEMGYSGRKMMLQKKVGAVGMVVQQLSLVTLVGRTSVPVVLLHLCSMARIHKSK